LNSIIRINSTLQFQFLLQNRIHNNLVGEINLVEPAAILISFSLE
jgi:hypothetical protein